jgi:hypothetical protein
VSALPTESTWHRRHVELWADGRLTDGAPSDDDIR